MQELSTSIPKLELTNYEKKPNSSESSSAQDKKLEQEAKSFFNLGKLYSSEKIADFTKAKEYYLRSLKSWKNFENVDEQKKFSSVFDLAGLYEDLGKVSLITGSKEEAKGYYISALSTLSIQDVTKKNSNISVQVTGVNKPLTLAKNNGSIQRIKQILINIDPSFEYKDGKISFRSKSLNTKKETNLNKLSEKDVQIWKGICSAFDNNRTAITALDSPEFVDKNYLLGENDFNQGLCLVLHPNFDKNYEINV